jgi:hypothetical protein
MIIYIIAIHERIKVISWDIAITSRNTEKSRVLLNE